MAAVSGGTSQRRRCELTARASAIANPSDHRDQDEDDVLERGRQVAVDVVDRPARAEGPVLGDAIRLGAVLEEVVADLRQREEARSPARASQTSGRSAAGCSSTSASRRGQELGDDLDREHARDRPAVVDHGRVLRLRLEQVRERVAEDVVDARPWASADTSGRSGTWSRARSASRQPPERAAIGVHDQRVRDLGALELARGPPPSPGRRTPAAPPRGRCRRPAAGPAASAPGRRRRSPRRSRWRAPSAARPGSRTARPARPRAGRRSGRPS